ncbi:MAG: phytanoyl-CoA dioxygenase family protein [Planctomycetota bacterium]|nr:phytanoyl-CoA dioxygenase family protein [Planctomycetota bacterium]
MTAPIGLTAQEKTFFDENGYLGPYTLCSPEEMAGIREQIVQEVLTRNPTTFKTFAHQSRHLDCRVVYDLCAHPAIVERMAALFGPDLVLWRSNFFVKHPGDKEIPWHQDWNYWPIDPVINISAWLAIDECTPENSCVQILPGTHKLEIPHVKAPEGMAFQEMVDLTGIDTSKAVNMILKPGQFFLFNERTLHHSNKNTSDKRRIGLAVRVTVPKVKVHHEKLYEGHKVIVIRGEDRVKLNQVAPPPEVPVAV